MEQALVRFGRFVDETEGAKYRELAKFLLDSRFHPGSGKIAATRNKVTLRYGPLICNIEQKDQDITKRLGPASPRTPEWRDGLPGGVAGIRGRFTDGGPMPAIPNDARMNREPGLPYPPPAPPPGRDGKRSEPPPPVPAVWITEGQPVSWDPVRRPWRIRTLRPPMEAASSASWVT